jgi:hypothetical protein
VSPFAVKLAAVDPRLTSVTRVVGDETAVRPQFPEEVVDGEVGLVGAVVGDCSDVGRADVVGAADAEGRGVRQAPCAGG